MEIPPFPAQGSVARQTYVRLLAAPRPQTDSSLSTLAFELYLRYLSGFVGYGYPFQRLPVNRQKGKKALPATKAQT